MSPESTGAAGSRARAWVLGGVALAVRLAYWAVLARHYRPVSDAGSYHALAANLAANRGYVDTFPQLFLHPTAFRPPLYPALLSVVYRLVGPTPAAGQALNALIGAADVVLVDRLLQGLGRPRAGLAAAAVLAVYPPLLANDVTLLTEPLGLALLLLMALAVTRRRWPAAGLALGALVLCRTSGELLVPFVIGWIVVKAGWRPAVRLALTAGLVVAPWVVRNAVVLHDPVVVTSNGFNLAAVYSPSASPSGRFVDPVFDHRFQSDRLLQFDEPRWDRRLRDEGLAGLWARPGHVLTVAVRGAEGLSELRPGLNRWAEVVDGRSWAFRSDTLPAFFVVTALGVVGWWRRRGDLALGLLGWCAAASTAASALTVAAPRLRAPLDLVCCIGAGLVLAGLPAPAVVLARARSCVGRGMAALRLPGAVTAGPDWGHGTTAGR